MRKWFALVAVVAVAVATPLAVRAATGTGGAHINCQNFVWTTSPASTSSSAFTNIPGLTQSVDSVFGMTVNVSVVITGEPVALRVRDTSVGGTFNLEPGVAFFKPDVSGTTSFSFTWVTEGAPAVHSHAIDVQWRRTSASGTSTLQRGQATVTYEAQMCPFVRG